MRNPWRYQHEQNLIENPKFYVFKRHSAALRIVAKARNKAGIMPSESLIYQLDKLVAKHYID